MLTKLEEKELIQKVVGSLKDNFLSFVPFGNNEFRTFVWCDLGYECCRSNKGLGTGLNKDLSVHHDFFVVSINF